ncbi:enoyl-CoA hydratase/isomerase family protein [Gryllotalpicola reticulitermitis]|uniref:Enoyl-CoA hydratase/isomerase family protein n=1 Tax=Gryllotalpicola reticulitermitis TaxID=1184153 RepID=A0ABV8Q268_9MICO
MSDVPALVNDHGEPLMLVDRPADGVVRITFNRPRQRNAMSVAARTALLSALDDVRETARVIVLTGAGPAFCAGIDLKEANAEGPARDSLGGKAPWIAVQEAIRRHPAIVISAVNGFALGGGVTLINTSDLAIAAEGAQIGMPEIGFGLYPGLAGPSTQLRINQKRAAWMVLTGERISGTTAAEWGLVNAAVRPDELQHEVIGLATRVAEHDPVTLSWCKKALWEIPMHLSDWTSALEFGEGVGVQIRARTDVVAAGLSEFSAGRRNSTQGIPPTEATTPKGIS